MQKIILALVVTVGLIAMGCQNMGGRTSKAANVSTSDQKFLMAAAQDSISEVAVSQMAVKKASNNEVKQFAQRMVSDHTAMNDEMKQLAKQKGLTIPTRPDEQHAQQSAMLGQMSGVEFDKAYMGAQVADHAKTVAKFEDQAKNAKDPDVRSFASRHAGMMRQHLNEAKRVNETVSAGTTGTQQRGAMGTGAGTGTGTGTATGGTGGTGNQSR